MSLFSFLRSLVPVLVVIATSRVALAAPPAASTAAASSITTSSASLNGTGTPAGEAATGWFRISPTNPGTCNDTFGTRIPSVSGTDLGVGVAAVPYSISATGLTSGTTYYYCAIVENASGKAFGIVQSFYVPGAPLVTTEAPTALAPTSVTFEATGTPRGASTTGYFRWGAVDPGTCSDAFGSRAPTSGGPSLGSGSSLVAFEQAFSGLVPNTTYYYCAAATNTYGTTFGDVVSFTTPPAAPTATTNSASLVTSISAQLNGNSNPGGAATTGWFRYASTNPGTCNDTFGTRAPVSGGSSLGAGNTNVSFNQPVSSLSPNTTYYYCAIAENSAGKALGSVVQFTTGSLPTAVTVGTAALGNTTVTLQGSGIPNRLATTGWFRYSATDPGTCNDTFGSRAPVSGWTNLGSGTSSVAFQQGASGLAPNTVHYYCAITENSEGKAYGSVLSFRTHDAPTAVTAAVTNLTATSVTVNGTVTPNGAATTGSIRYGTTDPGTCSAGYGSVSGTSNLGAAFTAANFGHSLPFLTPNTTYYYCTAATNTYGTRFGEVMSFTTPANLPSASTSSATLVTGTTAQLRGSSNPGGATTTGWFRYATVSPGTCNDTFGTRAPVSGGSDLGSGTSSVSFNMDVVGLSQATTYYYCAIAENSAGKAFGSVSSFTTGAPPTAVTASVSSLGRTSATMPGSGIPNRLATTGWFRYSATDPGTCSDTFGSRAPTSGGTNLSNGTSSVTFQQEVTLLTPNTVYYYCAITENVEGKAYGSVLSFRTHDVPTVATAAVTNLTSTSVTMNGTAAPNGVTTTGYFRYGTTNPGTCSDTFGTREPTSGGAGLGAGYTSVAFARSSTATLTPNTTYYYCAAATNTWGTRFGEVMSFTTPANLPSVSTSSANNLTISSAQLRGNSNPGGAPTTGWFRYATVNPGTCDDTFGTRAPASGGADLGSGNSALSFAEGIFGLAEGTTYYYCAIAENSAGKVFGSVVQFTTPRRPTVATFAATPITTASTTLNGSASPNGFATTGYFRYSTEDPGTCSDTFGTRAPTSSGSSLGSGTSNVSYSQAVTGLPSATTYYFCAIATSSVGTSFGDVLSFTTPSSLPAVTTNAASEVTTTSAQIHGTATPNGSATTGWFRYATVNPGACNDSFGTRTPTSGGTELGSGGAPQSFSASLTGLTSGVTYYYCAIASNAQGTTVGALLSFMPSPVPSVTTGAASSVTTNAATLNGSANPNGSATTGWFRYATSDPGACSDTFGTRAPTSSGSNLGSGSSAAPYSQGITGLTAGTTYYYCAIANSSVGMGFGAVQSFTTPAVPVVTTGVATSVTGTGAQLNGTANPNGAATTGWFRYSATNPGTCSDSFGTRAPAAGGSAVGAGSSATPYSQTLTGLSPGTTYWFCAIAQNSVGTSVGALQVFSTIAAPTVTSMAATVVTSTSATLNGSADPNLGESAGWFRYSTSNPGTCNDAFGAVTSSTSLGAGSTPVAYSSGITGLSPGTTYWFCAIAQNASGPAFGSVLSFTTPAAPTVTTSAATALTSTTATLNGSANPSGSAGTGWFRYATSDPGTCDDTFGIRTPASSGTSLGSGSSAVAYSQGITGLTAGTTYYSCAIASNATGTSFGGVVSFTTPAAPFVTSGAVSSVTTTTATLNGSANPSGATATGWFRYSATNPGACSDSFGTRAPVAGSPLGGGTSNVFYSENLTGLTPGTTYWYCAIAQNSVGTSVGTLETFVTAALPAVTTNSATGVTEATATLNGTANPNGAATTGWFRYSQTNPGTCSDSFGLRAPASGGTNLGSGSEPAAFSQGLAGLTSGATYYYCAIASSSAGIAFGEVQSFQVAAAPSVSTLPASAVLGVSATIHGAGTPNGLSTGAWFRYATTSPGTCNDTFGTRAPTSGSLALGTGSSAVDFAQALTGLTAGTTYYYCAIVESSAGKRFGTVQSFTTIPAPVVTTSAASDVAATSALLAGSANPRGAEALGWFRYATASPGACNDAFGVRTPSSSGIGLGSGTSATPFSEFVTGLSPGTTYWYCAIAENASGKAFGVLQSFTTTAGPSVTTGPAADVAGSVATLSGTVNPNGAAATGWFRLGTSDPGACTDSFGARLPLAGGVSLGSGISGVTYTQGATGLAPSTTYYYCAIASTAQGTSYGAVLSFRTADAPVVATGDATSVTDTGALLAATANPNSSAATGWFRYGATDPGVCSDSFGTRAPGGGGASLGSGVSSVPYTQPLVGLNAGTTYWYCAIVENAADTAFGEVRSFTTLAAPVVTTAPADAVTARAATLVGSTTTGLAATTGWFRYSETHPGACSDAFGTRLPGSGGTELGEAAGEVPFTQLVAGLAPETTYYFCAIAQNSVGTGLGEVLSLTTAALPELPVVVTSEPTDVTEAGFTLVGTVNPGGGPTTAWFRYDTTEPEECDDEFGTRWPEEDGAEIDGAATEPVKFSEELGELDPDVTHWFCAIAENEAGLGFGEVLSVTTLGPNTLPIVTTLPPTAVAAGEGTIHGSANANGLETTGWFRYDTEEPEECDDEFGARVPASGSFMLGSGTAAVTFSEVLDGLPPTAVYYCAIGESSSGKAFGEVLSFTPGALAPAITTGGAAAVTGEGVTLSGSAIPYGSEAGGWFRIGDSDPGACSDDFGWRVPASGRIELGDGMEEVAFEQAVDGLEPLTTYWFCAAASNAGGAVFGEVLSFTTGPGLPLVVTGEPTVGEDGTVSFHGSANPRGSATTGWFRYGTEAPAECADDFGTRAPSVSGQALGEGREAVSYLTAAAGLEGTIYVCAIAENAAGVAVGEVMSIDLEGGSGEGDGNEEDGGCGCRTTGASRGSAAPVGALALLLLFLVRRRRVVGAAASIERQR